MGGTRAVGEQKPFLARAVQIRLVVDVGKQRGERPRLVVRVGLVQEGGGTAMVRVPQVDGGHQMVPRPEAVALEVGGVPAALGARVGELQCEQTAIADGCSVAFEQLLQRAAAAARRLR